MLAGNVAATPDAVPAPAPEIATAAPRGAASLPPAPAPPTEARMDDDDFPAPPPLPDGLAPELRAVLGHSQWQTHLIGRELRRHRRDSETRDLALASKLDDVTSKAPGRWEFRALFASVLALLFWLVSLYAQASGQDAGKAARDARQIMPTSMASEAASTAGAGAGGAVEAP